jgi:hypothetical protein
VEPLIFSIAAWYAAPLADPSVESEPSHRVRLLAKRGQVFWLTSAKACATPCKRDKLCFHLADG